MSEASPLVRIAADDTSHVMAETPGSTGIWDGIRFTIDDVVDCDYFVMLNNCYTAPIQVRCPPEHVWCLIQEPYVPGMFDWLIEHNEHYARIFTHYIPEPAPRYVRSQPALNWAIDRSYDELAAMSMPSKPKAISYVASNKTWLAGHRKRNALRDFLIQAAPDKVDIFGRGTRPIASKWLGLAPYRYSIAIENTACSDYWTEKVSDCFLSWTVPLYDGCPNLEDYFPAEAFIRIDASDRRAVLASINHMLQHDDYQRRLPALAEARRRMLEEYHLCAVLARAIRTYGRSGRAPSLITIPAYPGMLFRNWVRYYRFMLGQRILYR